MHFPLASADHAAAQEEKKMRSENLMRLLRLGMLFISTIAAIASLRKANRFHLLTTSTKIHLQMGSPLIKTRSTQAPARAAAAGGAPRVTATGETDDDSINGSAINPTIECTVCAAKLLITEEIMTRIT